jgi:hypothetical protein
MLLEADAFLEGLVSYAVKQFLGEGTRNLDAASFSHTDGAALGFSRNVPVIDPGHVFPLFFSLLEEKKREEETYLGS